MKKEGKTDVLKIVKTGAKLFSNPCVVIWLLITKCCADIEGDDLHGIANGILGDDAALPESYSLIQSIRAEAEDEDKKKNIEKHHKSFMRRFWWVLGLIVLYIVLILFETAATKMTLSDGARHLILVVMILWTCTYYACSIYFLNYLIMVFAHVNLIFYWIVNCFSFIFISHLRFMKLYIVYGIISFISIHFLFSFNRGYKLYMLIFKLNTRLSGIIDNFKQVTTCVFLMLEDVQFQVLLLLSKLYLCYHTKNTSLYFGSFATIVCFACILFSYLFYLTIRQDANQNNPSILLPNLLVVLTLQIYNLVSLVMLCINLGKPNISLIPNIVFSFILIILSIGIHFVINFFYYWPKIGTKMNFSLIKWGIYLLTNDNKSKNPMCFYTLNNKREKLRTKPIGNKNVLGLPQPKKKHEDKLINLP